MDMPIVYETKQKPMNYNHVSIQEKGDSPETRIVETISFSMYSPWRVNFKELPVAYSESASSLDVQVAEPHKPELNFSTIVKFANATPSVNGHAGFYRYPSSNIFRRIARLFFSGARLRAILRRV